MAATRKNRARQTLKSTAAINNGLESKAPQSSRPYFKAAALGVGTLALGCVGYWWKYLSNAEEYTYQPRCAFVDNHANYNFSVVNNQNDLFIARATGDALSGIFLHLKNAISQELPCLFGAALFRWVSAKMSGVTFVLASPKALDDAKLFIDAGYYSRPQISNDGYIFVRAKPEIIKEQSGNLVGSLRNEFFHRICDQANFHKTNIRAMRMLPYLNDKGEIDQVLKQDYVDSLEEFRRNIESIAAIAKKPAKKISPVEKDQLNKANIELAQYKPIVRKVSIIPESDYRNLVKPFIKNINGRQIIPKGTKLGNIIIPSDYVITSMKTHNNQVDLFVSNHGQSIAEIFAHDRQNKMLMKSQSSDNPFVGGRAYLNNSSDKILSELGSDIEDLDPNIKRHFAPKFCKHMGKYIGLEKDEYCDNSHNYPTRRG